MLMLSWLRPLGFSAVLLALTAHSVSRADTFASVRYDAQRDALVVRMLYDGTNPDHQFRIQWGACEALGSGYQLSADILDDQWKDKAVRTYQKTARFSLAEVKCRPVDITLRSAPRFIYTLHVPNTH